MATDGGVPQPGRPDDTDLPVRIHSCSRIGMQANPPRSGLGAWLQRR